jgi:hypothetical protein
MTRHEKEALITYLDGQLMVLCQTLKPHIDPDAVGTLYESTYDILHDLAETIIATETLRLPVAKKFKR